MRVGIVLFLILTNTISLFAQGYGNITFPIRSITEIIDSYSGEASQKPVFIVPEIGIPARTKVVFTGKRRRIGKRTKNFIKLWAQTNDVRASDADMLVEEFSFRQQDKEYWVIVDKTRVASFAEKIKEGDEIAILYFFLGTYDEGEAVEKDTSLSEEAENEEASEAKGKIEWIFVVHRFLKLDVNPHGDFDASGYLNQTLAAAVDKKLKVSGAKNRFLIDARQVKSKSKVIFTGFIQEIEKKKMRFLKLWAKRQGQPPGKLQLLNQEAYFREGDKDYCLPISKKIADDLERQLVRGDEVTIYTTLAGGMSQADSIEWLFIVEAFSW